MAYTNSWLCIYAIAQLGKPYVMGTRGEFQKSTQKTLYQKNFASSSSAYTNPNYNKSVKTHDCSGLVLGAMTCTTINGKPNGKYPIAHGATSQYNGDCKTKANNMKNFPKIPGTLVFHSEGSTKTHVGIYVGTFIDTNGNKHENAVVEAMGHKWGVLYSSVTNSKWNAWGQLKLCQIDTKVGDVFDARTSSMTGSGGGINIDVKKMQPFVATVLGERNITIDYDQIKAARVSAMMFFGGGLFDSSHKQRTYANPQLQKLTQECNNAGMPYALYVNVFAKTEIEADAECRALYYVVSRYSPKMGLWLSLQTNNTVAMNDKILEVYYKYIDRWGLKNRCGLYLTKAQLSNFSWGAFQNRFYLWLIDAMDVSKVDDELLQPSMFEVPD